MAAPEILIVEHDPAVLARWRSYIESANLIARSAADGLQGLAAVMMRAPDLILASVSVPKMDGYGLLQALRSNERTRDIPFILVDGVSSHATPQKNAAEASHILAADFSRDHLLDVLSNLLHDKVKRVIGSQTMAGLKIKTGALMPVSTEPEPKIDQHTLPMHFGQFLEGSPTTMMTIIDQELENAENIVAQAISKRNANATVLFSDIRDFTSISERLRSEQVVNLLNAYFARACEPIQRQHGWVVKFMGDGLVALFESPPGYLQDHAERAVKAGLLMILAATRFRTWISEHLPNIDLPEFSIGVGIHSGEVTLCKMGSAENAETTIIGDTVNIAARLEEKTKELAWSMVASQTTFDASSSRVLTGQHTALNVKGRTQPIEVIEIIGLQAKIASSDQERRFYEALGVAVSANSRTLRNKIKDRAHATLNTQTLAPGIYVPNYRLVKKLGEGGMSLVYLAERFADQAEVVLKMMPLRSDNDRDDDLLQRFIQEYALVSQIHHANVARIFEQGFTDTHAYIVLEYFAHGDLRGLIKSGIDKELAKGILVQIAGALSAIHTRGIVHRDLKPDNIMLRADGSLAIADFGIAKHNNFSMTQTRHGEVFGTPYYLSPEQALGRAVDARSDIYSLGVMFYELLMGRKPYYGDSVQALLYQHVHESIPILSAPFARFQPLLEKMMAKRVEDRFQNAQELLQAIAKL